PNPGLPQAVVPIGNGMAAAVVVQVDSLGVEVSGDTTGISVAAGSTNVTGTAVDMGRTTAYPVGVVTTPGTLTGGTGQLQGSLDGTNWFNIGTNATLGTTGSTLLAGSGPTPARYVRVVTAS